MNPFVCLQALLEQLETEERTGVVDKSTNKAGELLRAFRESLKLKEEEFAESAGVAARTLERWEREAASQPKVLQVRTWKKIFRDEMRALTYIGADLAPPIGDRYPGVFSRNSRALLPRFADADEIWCIKHRVRLYIGEFPEAAQIFAQRFKAGDGFKLHCAWIKHDDEEVIDKENLSDVRPASIVPSSFIDLATRTFAQIPELKSKLFGYEIPVKAAYKYGLANLPLSVLVVKYSKQAQGDKYHRPLDMFFEMLPAEYDENGMAGGDYSPSFFQVQRFLANEYFTKVLNRFGGMEDHLIKDWNDLAARLPELS